MSNLDRQQYVCFGVLYCVQFFSEVIFFQNHVLLSFAALVSYLVQFSWHPLLDFYGVLWAFYKVSMEMIWNFYGVSMIFYGVSKGVSMVVRIPLELIYKFYIYRYSTFQISYIFLNVPSHVQAQTLGRSLRSKPVEPIFIDLARVQGEKMVQSMEDQWKTSHENHIFLMTMFHHFLPKKNTWLKHSLSTLKQIFSHRCP